MPQPDLISFLSKHLVPIAFTFQSEGKEIEIVVTSFVFSVLDHWLLITAGHCIDTIEKFRKDFKLISCKLIDSFGIDAKFEELIPFTYEQSNPQSLRDIYGFDYGVVEVSDYYRQLLEKNGVVPLSEAVWKHQPSSVNIYKLLGMPAELVKPSLYTIMLITVQRVAEIPESFQGYDPRLFYGRVNLEDQINSIKGMSGGPIFAFHQNDEGEFRYYLNSLQSVWNSYTGEIVACPVQLLGNFLERIIGTNTNKHN